jgi:hypothetical protein
MLALASLKEREHRRAERLFTIRQNAAKATSCQFNRANDRLQPKGGEDQGHDQHGDACGHEGEQQFWHLSPMSLFGLTPQARPRLLWAGAGMAVQAANVCTVRDPTNQPA